MNTIHAAQAGQGGPVTIACINEATVDLGVPFDKLTAALQKCYDQHFLPVWGYPVKLYNTTEPKPSDWQFVYFDTANQRASARWCCTISPDSPTPARSAGRSIFVEPR